MCRREREDPYKNIPNCHSEQEDEARANWFHLNNTDLLGFYFPFIYKMCYTEGENKAIKQKYLSKNTKLACEWLSLKIELLSFCPLWAHVPHKGIFWNLIWPIHVTSVYAALLSIPQDVKRLARGTKIAWEISRSKERSCPPFKYLNLSDLKSSWALKKKFILRTWAIV